MVGRIRYLFASGPKTSREALSVKPENVAVRMTAFSDAGHGKELSVGLRKKTATQGQRYDDDVHTFEKPGRTLGAQDSANPRKTSADERI